MRLVGDQIAALDKQVAEVETELNGIASTLPNIPDERTPYGTTEDENVVLRTIGEPRKFDFTPLPHWDLGTALGRLSPEMRAVVQATVLDGLTAREAAQLLRIPTGTVKTAFIAGQTKFMPLVPGM